MEQNMTPNITKLSDSLPAYRDAIFANSAAVVKLAAEFDWYWRPGGFVDQFIIAPLRAAGMLRGAA